MARARAARRAWRAPGPVARGSRHERAVGSRSELPPARARATIAGDPARGAAGRRVRMGHLRRVGRGIAGAVAAHPGRVAGIVAIVAALSVLGPPLVLSLTRRPLDYATLNPWLKRLPGYLVDPTISWSRKAEKLPDLALFWFSADSPYGGTDWGFAVDVRDVVRILGLATLFGIYFALLAGPGRGASSTAPPGPGTRPGRRAGAAGVLTSLVGLSTAPCSVMGCGAPVIPVVGLAFAGLSSGTLALLASLSRAVTALVFGVLVVAVIGLGWRAGGRPVAAREAAPSPGAPRWRPSRRA